MIIFVTNEISLNISKTLYIFSLLNLLLFNFLLNIYKVKLFFLIIEYIIFITQERGIFRKFINFFNVFVPNSSHSFILVIFYHIYLIYIFLKPSSLKWVVIALFQIFYHSMEKFYKNLQIIEIRTAIFLFHVIKQVFLK